MNIRTLTRNLAQSAVALAAVLALAACSGEQFHVQGTIAQAKDSTLYFENMSLNGAVTVDSVKLGEDGSFAFSGDAPSAPEFYRLRIAGQIINVAVDSTENITVRAAYPTMASSYEVEGSDECLKIRELALLQMQLQARVNAVVAAPTLGVDAVNDSVSALLEAYKQNVKTDYIFREPMRAYSYYALFQTINVGQLTTLIFNPRNSEADVKVFAAVATSWDAFYPQAERGLNLHNIAIEGMKNVRIIRSRQQETYVDAAKVNTSGVIDINLPDNKGGMTRLSSLKGKVVLLDFHAFATEGSTERIMNMRQLYNKYHDRGFEIYQVSLDDNEHFWKTQTAALPWINVHVDDTNADVVRSYNVQSVPTFFLLDRQTNVVKRDIQIRDIDAEISSLL